MEVRIRRRIRRPRKTMAWVAAASLSLAALSPHAHAGFPGANGKIVFAGDRQIYTVTPSGRKLTRIHHSGADPAWSPDGKRIAFTDRTDAETAVFMMASDGSRVRRVTPKGLDAYEPAWSPDGRRLVFTVVDAALNEDLFTLEIGDDQPQRLTDLPTYEFMASWSPDGERIAFVVNDPLFLTSDIYTVRPDGTDLQRVTQTPLEPKYSPGWSPDGESLVFEGFAPGATQADLYVIGADGSDQRQVTDTPWQEQWPSFSPDGTRLLFGSDRDDNWDIYTLRIDGTGLKKVTHNASDERVADWQAR